MSEHIRYFRSVSTREKSWGLYVSAVSHVVVGANEPYPEPLYRTAHDFEWERGVILEEFSLLHIVGGSGIFESAHQRPLDIHAGDCIILFPGEWHRYKPEETTGWEEYGVLFAGNLVESWRQANFIRPQSPLLLRGDGHLLLPIFEDMLWLAKRKSGRSPLESAALCHLLLARLLSAPKKPSRSETKYQRLHEAGDYLRMHPEDDVDLPTLARHLGMSYSNFRRSFTKHFGSSPDRFHQDARVARVKQFLIETELPLKEIAERLHYSDEFYMMRAFKRYTGLTTTQWRHRRLN
ncbi:MAG: helix-turn-helix domain-containing protein [Acidobacteriaceae bacterium]